MLYFKNIDDSPLYQDMDTLMNSYVNLRNQRKYNNRKLNIPTKNEVQMRNFQNQYKNRYQRQFQQQINSNSQTGSSNINLIKNPKPKKHKRNVSESKKNLLPVIKNGNVLIVKISDNTYEVDHIIALYKGGSNELNNLEALCRNCHGKKTFMEKMGI